MFELSIVNYDSPLYNKVLRSYYMSSVYKLIKIYSKFFNDVCSKNVEFFIKKI